MTRQDFIFTLFDNGEGLTFDQIATIEELLKDEIPEGVIEDITADMGEDATEQGIMESALYMSRDVFIDNMSDCEDMLALRFYINSYLAKKSATDRLTDMQVYRLWYVTRGGID